MLQKLLLWFHVFTNFSALAQCRRGPVSVEPVLPLPTTAPARALRCQAFGPHITRENHPMQETPPPAAQPRNPLHGVTLEPIVRALEARYRWPALTRQVPVRCFTL
ncbi:VF530 family DNA-binding protein, partial [Delftia acidovorans]|uniref:VF530 family DNA-binding protein n=1 Tax=Delftia acidovorans TaxID=80866 RepID=UPI00359F8F41